MSRFTYRLDGPRNVTTLPWSSTSPDLSSTCERDSAENATRPKDALGSRRNGSHGEVLVPRFLWMWVGHRATL